MKITDIFYAGILEFIMNNKELFGKMSVYEKMFDYPGLDVMQRKNTCLDWFIFDYREPESSRSVLDIYLEAAEIEPDKKVIYSGFRNSVYGVFEVKAVKTGKEAVLSDFISGMDHQVTDTTFTRNIQKGDVCIIRILPFKEIKILTGSGYKMPGESAVFLKINKETFKKLKGGITPLDIVKLFFDSDRSSKMNPKEKLLYLAGKANIDEDNTGRLMEIMEKEAGLKGDPVPILKNFIEKAGRLETGLADKLGQAAINYWNSLLENDKDYVAKGPVENAIMALAFSRFETIVNTEKEKDPKKAQARMDEWFKTPLAVLGNKTPEEAIVEERKQLKNPELRVKFSYTSQAIKDPEFEKAEKEAEKLFYAGAELVNKGDHRGALVVFEKYNKIWDGNHVVHFNMGVCNYFMENYAAAEECMKKALKIDPNYEKARAALNDLKKRKPR
jgi:tetratricopeptide (TPR) repeat protein